MSNEEIVKEIDEATNLMTEARVKTNEALCHARNVVMNSKGNEEAYNKGLNDAWELARKIVNMTHSDKDRILGTNSSCNGTINVMNDFTPQEALAKLEAYEKEQNEIKVGDVVKNGNGETEFVVIATSEETINGQPILRPIGKTLIKGVIFASDTDLKKTGKHIDLTDLFKQIGGAE